MVLHKCDSLGRHYQGEKLTPASLSTAMVAGTESNARPLLAPQAPPEAFAPHADELDAPCK